MSQKIKTSNNYTFRAPQDLRDKLAFVAANHQRTESDMLRLLISEAYEIESQPGYVPPEIQRLKQAAREVAKRLDKV